MTQLAAVTTTTIGKTAGKSQAAKASAGADFAAAFAAMADATGPRLDADGMPILPEGAGMSPDADTPGDGKGEEPVVLDLALGAAAQSATADMVVSMPIAMPMPVPAPAPPVPVTRKGGSDAAKAIDPAAIASAPVAPSLATSVAPSLVDGTASIGRKTERTVLTDGQSVPVPVAVAMKAAVEGAATPSPAAMPKVEKQAVAVPKDGAATPPPAAMPKVEKQTVAVSKDGAVATTATAIPAMMRAQQAATRVVGEARVPADAASTMVPEGAATAIPIAVMIPQEAFKARQSAKVAKPERLVVPVQGEAVDPAVATDVAPAAIVQTAGQPVMSSLHRAIAHEDAARQPDATGVPADAGTGGNGSSGTTSDKGAGGAMTGGAPTDTAQGSTDVAPAGTGIRDFSDIVQNLPPIAQSRIGVADVGAVTAPTVDVSAAISGQVIDMGVGGQWIDRVAQEITALADGTGHSRFQLSPPNLGRIQIDVWHGADGDGRVQMLAETDEATKRLRDGQSSLQADARLASLSIGSIVIDKAPGSFDAQQRDQGQQNPTSRQQQADSSLGSQTGGQSAQNGQSSAQAGAQGQNSTGQHKGQPRRDVFNDRAGTNAAQDGGSARRDGDRLVRYA